MPTIEGSTTGETLEQKRLRLGLLPPAEVETEGPEESVTYKHDEAAGKVVAKRGKKPLNG